ncbi:Ribose 5-phosphate isomerase A [hydrothermal vent metagenome]|uniref:ribose-5-phosphate isomerase n=1 Tax=hydrothermal vent metagenome TaxID=652676 RepID=A0A3B0SVS0_9ZZZZ
MNLDADQRKCAAAARAVEIVTPGMRLGLGTGSTAAHFVRLLGSCVRAGLNVTGVPTSEATAELARDNGIALGSLDASFPLDLTVDGADEFDKGLTLIKGGGGALLREKIVAQASRRMIVIADADKQVETLGAFPLAVEIVRFSAGTTTARISTALAGLGLAIAPVLRTGADGAPFITDEGHYIVDCACGAIAEPPALAGALEAIAGVVDHGLFIGIATGVIVGHGDGSVTELGRI